MDLHHTYRMGNNNNKKSLAAWTVCKSDTRERERMTSIQTFQLPATAATESHHSYLAKYLLKFYYKALASSRSNHLLSPKSLLCFLSPAPPKSITSIAGVTLVSLFVPLDACVVGQRSVHGAFFYHLHHSCGAD